MRIGDIISTKSSIIVSFMNNLMSIPVNLSKIHFGLKIIAHLLIHNGLYMNIHNKYNKESDKDRKLIFAVFDFQLNLYGRETVNIFNNFIDLFIASSLYHVYIAKCICFV